MSIGGLLRGLAPVIPPDRSLATFELHIVFAGTGTGSVTRNPPNLISKSDGKSIYTSGHMVDLFANPDKNSVFTGWSEDVQGVELACSVVMSASKKVVANFSLVTEQEKRIGPFIDNCDGTVTDSRTGLIWLRCAIGQIWGREFCSEDALLFTWDEAQAVRHSFAGFDNWRLPNIDELRGLVDMSQHAPSVDINTFPQFPSRFFWTSSCHAENKDFGWLVYFANGFVNVGLKGTKGHIRLVRSGSSTDTPPYHAVSTVVAHGIVRTAVELIKQSPSSYAVELEELRRLFFLNVPSRPAYDFENELALRRPSPKQTFSQVLTWLATQDRVSVAVLRSHLIPLDLLPSAVIDELNERALDLTGEPALEEGGEGGTVLVAKEILAQVLTSQNFA